ncbi:MAG: glycerol-3-phosphate acyltransferase [Clostridia bacterium]|nr:glycerol-3-phosphate acyltransferase [Clostridia bacterium]
MIYSLWLAVIGVCSYLFGSFNWALIISRLKKLDIRKVGSGNPGTLNMSRNLGFKFGLLTFFLDLLKGAMPTLVAFFVFNDQKFSNSDFYIRDFAIYLSGLCVVLGHIYPIYFKFKGGKGIASTIGVFMVCESVHGIGWATVAIMALVAAAVFIYLTEFGAMGSFIAITPPAISGCIRLFLDYGRSGGHTFSSGTLAFLVVSNMFIFAICFFTWFAHRKNIERMLAGEEHPTSFKKMMVKARAKKIQEQKQSENDNL